MAALGLWALGLTLLWGRLGEGSARLTATAPPAPPHACSEFSQGSCEECLKNVSCLWCYTNNTCIDYPVRSILPSSSVCSLLNARWGVCWSSDMPWGRSLTETVPFRHSRKTNFEYGDGFPLWKESDEMSVYAVLAENEVNFEVFIIAIAVVAGLILVSFTACCCYCCYCRRRSRSRLDVEEERLARKREERRLEALQRKHERKLKHDEIRKKYGLLQDSDHPYSRFENE